MIYIETLEGTRHDLTGLKPIRFNIDSLSPRTTMEYVEGRDGFIDLGTSFDGRILRAAFLLQSNDIYDYSLLLNEVFKLFDSRTHFYLIHKYQPQKRWKVKTAMPFTPERVNPETGILEIEFISPSPFAESIGTTLDPFTFDTEKWQIGQGLHDLMPSFAHSTTSFSIYNASDIEIDPRQLPIKIKYQGASNGLKIKNTTTGDEWAHTGASNASDTILLDGIRSLKNGLTIFGQTNRKLITLAPGWNDFTLSGTSGSFLISFDFRFYYI